MIKEIYTTSQTVFDLKDLGFCLGENNYDRLKSKVAYYVKQGYVQRIRRGLFVKPNFDPRELACKIYTPSYISFETILAKHNVIFQYDTTIYIASYLSRYLEISYQNTTIQLQYRKLKDEVLYHQEGIVKQDFVSYASPERAVQDMRYLQPDFYFDNLPDAPTTT